ncbi:error-prone DNA polymerase [Neorhizobium alkalisoli]|uniref:Error-prone DNA polymerase n=1 Tax=Neorhizobium alkalisoli TaxID=528178 RepID=A0A561Q889_9HYPH|nr:error-prone DNA polymerase [Neorhizobium alkalisoli]TWF46579.1 DnaE-like error-prone DNA polymerase [Neorhizobium alkalisoli]
MTSGTGFCEIGAKTNFSFLEGAARPEEMVFAASALGLSGLGIADRNSVAGVVRAFTKARDMKARFERAKEIGPEAVLKEDPEPIFEPVRLQYGARLVFSDETPDVLAYPQNRKGWANLCRLLSRGNLRTEKGSCIIEEWDFWEWCDEMMLAVVPDFSQAEDAGYQAHLRKCLVKYRERFGRKIYLALSPTYDGRDAFVFATFAQIADECDVPLIATNLPLFHLSYRRPISDVVTAIREHVTVQEAGFRFAANGERHIKQAAEMARLFSLYPQAVANTERFFRKLDFSLKELQHNYPDESVEGETVTQTLERLTLEGARRRYPDRIPEKVSEQIRYELDLIADMQYEPYFLTVRHIVWHARHVLKILCQGRGSAANSTVCFCLGITDVDPTFTTLLFERFISTERNEPPDIDVDFEHSRREEVIQYIYEHYGYRHAGLTAAVTSYRTRMAGREVAKAFGLSEDVQAALSSMVWGWSEDGMLERDAKAAGLDTKDPVTLRVMALAQEIMGFPRHLTQHVGGFLITRDRLDEVVPIMKTAMPGRYMIEWDKDDLDTLGLLKIDVLALGMLTCLKKAFELMEVHYERKETLPSLLREKGEDQNVYNMICRADTIGVFQIESRAQMSMLPRLQPRKFYDLVVEVAIVRPGPIQGNMVHPYLKRREDDRHGRPIEYPSPELKEVLKRTLGVPLFQEQAMQIAITAAGFSPAKADMLRRSMATFKRSGRVEGFKNDMINGMLENRYSREFAESCFSQIQGFAEYGFPESHAASFALLVYASSWIKTYYPDVFCAAMLNSQPMGFYAPAQLIRDAREHGVTILPVDVNRSQWDCTLEEMPFERVSVDPRHQSMRDVILTRHAVRLGFRQVKGLAEKDMVEKLVGNRAEKYRSVHDLSLRSGLDRSDLERLADADGFNSIGLNRRQALWAVRGLDGGKQEEDKAGQPTLFALAKDVDLRPEAKVALPTMLPGEEVIEDYRYLSLSLKAHPVSFLRERFQSLGITRSVDLLTVPNGQRITIGGLVLVRQRPGSAKGVIFMTLEDETGVANAIVWPKVFERYRAVVMGARLVKIRGRLQSQSGVIHTVVEHIEDMTPMLGLLQKEARRFGVSERADETLKSSIDHRQKSRTGSNGARQVRDVTDPKRVQPYDIEPGDVMPKGRNFH